MSANNSTFARPTIPGPVFATRAPRVPLPAGSCDCHAQKRTRILVDNPARLYGF